MTKKIICYGCGALIDHLEGQAHKYIGAPLGCWNLYGQILAKEYGEYNYPELTHKLTVDTYAIQHPGVPGRQSIQSVNIHLIGLYLILEKGFEWKPANEIMKKILFKNPKFQWLDPPHPNGQLTVQDVLEAESKEAHVERVREWAENVWNSWNAKHGQAMAKLVSDYL